MSKQIPPSIYFGGAACGVPFFMGIIRKMREKWGNNFYTKTLICGGSIGSVVGLMLVSGYSDKEIHKFFVDLGNNMIKEPKYLRGQNLWLNDLVDNILIDNPELYKLLESKFMCGTTKFLFQHQWHSSWTTNEELGRCLKGSYNIPLYCDHCDKIHNEEVIDGAYGFNDSEFPHGNDTLFVGCNQTCAELNYVLNIDQMITPNVTEGMDLLIKKGEEVFDNWDGVYNDKKGKRKPNYIALILCWIGKIIQLFYDYVCNNIIEAESTYDSVFSKNPQGPI